MMNKKLCPYHQLKGPVRRAKRRRQAVSDVESGLPIAEVARLNGVSRQTLYTWLERSSEDESGEVVLRPHGRPPLLNEEHREVLSSLLAKAPEEVGLQGGRWTLERVRHLVKREFGVTYSSLSSVSTLIRSLGYGPGRR